MKSPFVIKVARLANHQDLPLPEYKTPGAAGMDLVAAIPDNAVWWVVPYGRLLVPTGLAFEIPEGFEMQIRPRSGLAKNHGITVLNAPGTIDADYRGEVGVLLFNASDSAFAVRRGGRIAQAVLAPIARASWWITDTLEKTDRGTGGFGSTGTQA